MDLIDRHRKWKLQATDESTDGSEDEGHGEDDADRSNDEWDIATIREPQDRTLKATSIQTLLQDHEEKQVLNTRYFIGKILCSNNCNSLAFKQTTK
jgi:hypothetical protein